MLSGWSSRRGAQQDGSEVQALDERKSASLQAMRQKPSCLHLKWLTEPAKLLCFMIGETKCFGLVLSIN